MSQPYWHGRMVGFDLETDSANPDDARIITAALVHVGGTQPTIADTWVLQPTRPIPDEAAAIHGYSTERARAEGIDPATALDLIAGQVALTLRTDTPAVGHNASYDFTVLSYELDRHSLPSLEDRLGRPIAPVVDTLVLDKAVHPFRKGSRKLIDVARHYGIVLTEAEAHGAVADALTAARVAWRIGSIGSNDKVWKVFGLPDNLRAPFAAAAAMTAHELHDAQIPWAAGQAKSLAAYFKRTGKHAEAASVTGEWPLRRMPVGAVAR